MKKTLFIATGAYDCGKTTTLQKLSEMYGYNTHPEVHLQVVADLGDKVKGHDTGKNYHKITEDSHECPICKPKEHLLKVLDKQSELEKIANEGDFLERSYVDAIEYYQRNSSHYNFEDIDKTVRPEQYKDKYSNYVVFLFDVLPEVQSPKWGKNVMARINEAMLINNALYHMYTSLGYDVHLVRKDTPENRAKVVHGIIQEKYVKSVGLCDPTSSITDLDEYFYSDFSSDEPDKNNKAARAEERTPACLIDFNDYFYKDNDEAA